jgi:hypothetical protein
MWSKHTNQVEKYLWKETPTLHQLNRQLLISEKKQVRVHRTQFSLTLDWASTIHKAQGKTLDQLVVCSVGTYRTGQMYTALSRVKTLEGLYLIKEFRRENTKVNTGVVKEMQRLSSTNLFKVPKLQVPTLPDIYLNLSLLNINSLKPHFQCLYCDENVHTSDIIFLTETWLQANHCDETYELGPNYQIYRNDRKSVRTNLNPHGGVAIQVEHKFQTSVPYRQHSL